MKSLVILALLSTCLQNSRADLEHPHYSYRCLESTGIDIFGIHTNSQVTITEGNTTTECKPKKDAKELFYRILYNCTQEKLNETTNATIGYQVGIHVIDSEFDTSSTPINPLVKGGHTGHSFRIMCYNIPENGVEETVAKVFQGGPHPLPENHKEVSPIEMHFKATMDIDAPDISEIYIGDEFFMFLKYTGDSDYKVIPKTCTAYAGTVLLRDSKKKVSLWNDTKPGCKVNEELLSSITSYNQQNKVIAAKMYGFKFQDSKYITIACEVGVFPLTSPKKICKTPKRKRDTRIGRRDVVDTAIHRKRITGKLRIVDNPSELGNMASKPGGSFEWIKLFFGVMILSSLFGAFE